MTDAEFGARYSALMHGLQSAIATSMELEIGEALLSRGMDPGIMVVIVRALKHMRVGVNSSLASNGALAKLLVDKGIISQDEHREYLLRFVQDEFTMAAREACERLGVPEGTVSFL